MEITTFDDDLLGLKDFAKRLEHFIDIEQQYVEDSLVIGLSSKFGFGKSSFLKMWMSSLRNPEKKEGKPLVIFLNAWESDYYGDPLFAIISALVDSIKNEGKSPEKILDAVKDFGWFSTAIGGQIVEKLTGVNALAAGEIAEKKKKIRGNKVQNHFDTFAIYEGRKNAMLSLKDAIKEFIQNNNSTILFLVDELDRCRPDYAISYLETIKHIFDIKGAVFLLAADRLHLKNSAKKAFGYDLDFEEYYRKFVHREITLPEISYENYLKLAMKYVNHYLERDGIRNCYMQLDSDKINNIANLVSAIKLTPRQIQEIFRVLGHTLETSAEKKGRMLWCIATGTIMMSVFKIGKPEIFHLLGTQQLQLKEAYNFFKEQLKLKHFEWWITLCITGGGMQVRQSEGYEDIFRNIAQPAEFEEFKRNYNSDGWSNGWGYTSNRIVQIYEKIQQIYQWD